MGYTLSENLSPKARAACAMLLLSGQSESIAVGECLNSIAENGDESASDEFLAGCAEEISEAANAAIKMLRN